MTHIDGAPTVWPCCDSWECALAIQDGLGAWDALEHYGPEGASHVDQ